MNYLNRVVFTLLLMLACICPSFAQSTVNGDRTFLGLVDASGATATKPFQVGTSLPSTCTVNQWFNVVSGSNTSLYDCTATNTWTQYSSGTLSGSVQGESVVSSTIASSTTTANGTSSPYVLLVPPGFSGSEMAPCANFNYYFGTTMQTGLYAPTCNIASGGSIIDYRSNYSYLHNPTGYTYSNNTFAAGYSMVFDNDNPVSFMNRFGYGVIVNANAGGHNDSVPGISTPNKTNYVGFISSLVSHTGGQHIGYAVGNESYGNGDALLVSGTEVAQGGFYDNTGEGNELTDLQLYQPWDLPQGTISAGGTGLSSVTLTLSTSRTTNGLSFAGDGRALIDTSSSYSTGSISAISSTTSSTVLTGTGVTWPVSTLKATLGTAVPTDGGTETITPSAYTIGSSSQLVANNVYCVGPINFETIKITSASSGAFTATFKHAHPSTDFITAGGYCGAEMYLSADDNTPSTFNGYTMVHPPATTLHTYWPVLDTPSATTMELAVVARGVIAVLPTEWTSSNEAYAVFPNTAIVTSIVQSGVPSNTWTLAPNNAVFTTGDNFEEAQSASKRYSYGEIVIEHYTPNMVGGGAGYAYNGVWGNGDVLFNLQNNTPFAKYTGQGGTVIRPTAINITGPLNYLIQSQYGGTTGGIFVGCPDTGCTNSFYQLMHWGDASGGNSFMVDQVNSGVHLTTGGAAYDFFPAYYAPHANAAASLGMTSSGWSGFYLDQLSSCATPSTGIVCVYLNTSDGKLHTVNSAGTDAVLSGSSSSGNASQIQNANVASTSPGNNQALVYSTTTNQYVPTTIYNLGNGLGTTASGTSPLQVNVSMNVRTVTGTSDTLQSTDCGGLVTYTSSSAVTVYAPQPVIGGNFLAGCPITLHEYGAGGLTITPSSSTVGGNSSQAVSQNKGCLLVSDGTNWQLGNCN